MHFVRLFENACFELSLHAEFVGLHVLRRYNWKEVERKKENVFVILLVRCQEAEIWMDYALIYIALKTLRK
jgi:hypothetical protein